MGEALIARGLAMDPDKVVKYGEVIKTEIITNNTIWQVPGNCIINKGVSVRIFGGGGGCYGSGGGGGGGCMNNAILTNLNIYDRININIGAGGDGSGGTTYFGNYLSANGGQASRSMMGANGGSGGGGASTTSEGTNTGGEGGDGSQFGGGGAGCYNYRYSWYWSKGGNGGTWGGGGGGGAYHLIERYDNGASRWGWNYGIGGKYGGNGGYFGGSTGTTMPENGTNISTLENLILEDLSAMESSGKY